MGFGAPPLSLLLYQSACLLNPEPGNYIVFCSWCLIYLVCCILYFSSTALYIVFCISVHQPCINCILYFSIRFAFSSQMYLPTETPSSHFYLLPSHLPSRGKKPLNTKDLSAARLALNILSQIFVCLPFHSRILHLSLVVCKGTRPVAGY